MDKVIITVGVTGGVQRKEDNSALPVTPEEIIESAYGAWEAGAAVVHLHVRDERGQSCADNELYARVMRGVQERCDVLVNLTTDPGGNVKQDERIKVLELAPPLASVDAGTMHLFEDLVWGPIPYLRQLLERMREVGTKPQCEVFHEGMIATCERLADEGVLERPIDYQFMLGTEGGALATPRTLLHFVDQIDPNSTWSVMGFGSSGPSLAALAIGLGGHVRTGIEDSPFYRPGELATTNAQLVARIARIANELGREIATPTDARRLLQMRSN